MTTTQQTKTTKAELDMDWIHPRTGWDRVGGTTVTPLFN